jgi:aspartate/methionine/tyrosine aminotransferase
MTKDRLLPAQRSLGVNSFRVMDVLEQARKLEQAGRDIVHLEVGEPDFSTAAPVAEAGARALLAGRTAYTPASGLPELRERIAAFYRDHHGVAVHESRILITPGASGALVLLANLLLNPGDKVLMPDPAYPCNRNYVHLMGAKAILLPPSTVGQAAPSIAQLEAACDERVKGLWLASPVNPTGAVIAPEQLRELSAWARLRGVHLLMDEIYHGLDFVRPISAVRTLGDLPTALAFDDENFVVNSFSKYFGMTGWRVGWLVVPQCLVTRANILAQNLFIAAATPSQYAALRALDADVVEIHEQRRAAFRSRRDFLASALRNLGFDLPWQPDGAFYCYAAIDRFGDDCEQFCSRMLTEHAVAITPGTDFGDYRARQFVRFAYTRSLADLEKAVDRMQRALQTW